MRKFFYSFAVFATAISVSCSKQNTQDVNSGVPAEALPASLTAVTEQTKLTMSGPVDDKYSFIWDEGDEILARSTDQKEACWSKDNDDCDRFTAVSGGASAIFSGTLRFGGSGNLYLFSSRSGFFVTANSNQFSRTIAAQQSGKIDDVQENIVLMGSGKNIEKIQDSYSFTATMKAYGCILKLNVAPELDVRKIEVEGTSLSGKVRLKYDGTRLSENSISSEENKITVSRDGDLISGDVYIVAAPTSIVEKIGVNDSESLKFTFTTGSGKVGVISGALNSKLKSGYVKNFGNITSLPAKVDAVFAGSDDNKPIINVTSTEDGSAFYYECSAEGFDSIGDPTEASGQLPSDGITVNTDNDYNIMYYKFLAVAPNGKKNYVKAIARFWKVTNETITSVNTVINFNSLICHSNAIQDSFCTFKNSSSNKNYIYTYSMMDGSLTAFAKVASHKDKINTGTNFLVDGTSLHTTVYTDNTYAKGNPTFDICPSNGNIYPAGTEIRLLNTATNGNQLYIYSFATLEYNEYKPLSANVKAVASEPLSASGEYAF